MARCHPLGPGRRHGAGPVRLAKVLQIVSERGPEVLYPKIGFFIDLLDTDNRIIRWNAILITGNLAAVDSKRKIDRILHRYLDPIPGPELITAANTIRGAVAIALAIALAKPELADRIVDEILKVEKGSTRPGSWLRFPRAVGPKIALSRVAV